MRTSANDRVLFDNDMGGDDAIAAMMLYSSGEAETVAVTCVGGNTGLDNVVRNNLRLLKLHDMLGKVPLHRGCAEPLLGYKKPESADFVQGGDGLGGKPHVAPTCDDDDMRHVSARHAVDAIIRASKEHAGRLTLVATGPLTNLAVACKLDPALPGRLKALYIMGGTRHGVGNIVPAAEFNFYYDPEAAFIALREFPPRCSTHLIDFELTTAHPLSLAWYDEWLRARNRKQTFAREITESRVEFSKALNGHVVICDAYCMAAALAPEVVSSPREFRVCVELSGNASRGHLVIDRCENRDHTARGDFVGPVVMYDAFDVDRYKELLVAAVA